MPRTTILEILPPLGGLDKGSAFQKQPPFTSPDLLNVRPVEGLSSRMNMGVRPGLQRRIQDQLGGGNEINMMAFVTSIGLNESTKETFFLDEFQVVPGLTPHASGNSFNPGSEWSASNGSLRLPVLWGLSGASTLSGGIPIIVYSTLEHAAILDDLTGFDPAVNYKIILNCMNSAPSFSTCTFRIWARMDDATPILDGSGTKEGILIKHITTAGTYAFTGSLVKFDAGVETEVATWSGTGISEYGPLHVLISGANITVNWQGTEVLAATGVHTATSTEKRMGFSLQTNSTSGVAFVENFRVEYSKTTAVSGGAKVGQKIYVAASNGVINKLETDGNAIALSTTASLAKDRALMATEFNGLLYIADNEHIDSGTDGLRGNANTDFDDSGGQDWTTLSINVNDHHLKTFASTNAQLFNGTHTIASIASDELTVTEDLATGASGACSYSIHRGIKVYNPANDTMILLKHTAPAVDNPGGNPVGCTIIAAFQNCLVLAGDPDFPTEWFMSRQGNARDWDYDKADAQAAVKGTAGGEGTGILAGAITALIPYEKDYMLIAESDALHVMRGHPRYGGRIDTISREVGIIDRFAWAHTPEGGVVFLSRDGMWHWPSGGKGLEKISSQLPAELRGILTDVIEPMMVYDSLQEGFYIFLPSRIDRQSIGGITDYWMPWGRPGVKGFYPFRIPTTMRPTSFLSFFDKGVVIIGGADGRVRDFRANAFEDDGTSIASHITYGPFKAARSGFKGGLLKDIQVEMDELTRTLTGKATVQVSVGTTPQEALQRAIQDKIEGPTHDLFAGRQRTWNPRVSGRAFCLKIKGASGTVRGPWSVDSITAKVLEQGEHRSL